METLAMATPLRFEGAPLAFLPRFRTRNREARVRSQVMRRWLLTTGLVFLAGCGGETRFAPISGRVTLNDAPLADAWVNFQPIGAKDRDPGPGSVGKTDKDGRYVLRVDASRSGAVVGKHRVMFSTRGDKAEGDADAGGTRYPDKVPIRYSSVETILRCDVPPEGRTDANYELKSP